MPKSQVTLQFVSTHLPPVQIDGIVETFEPNMFTKEPTSQISIICPDPAFTAVDATVIPSATVATDSGDLSAIIDYLGTLETGLYLTVKDNTGTADSSGDVRITNTTDVPEFFTVVTPITSTHYLEVSTQRGNKFANDVVISSGVKTSLLNLVAAGSKWIQLKPGKNSISIETSSEGQDVMLQFFARYGGL